MTNAEKYLKDGVDEDILITEIVHDFIHEYIYRQDFRTVMTNFFKRICKPTLTEDERVILKNIKKDYKFIGKTKFLGVTILYASEKEKAEDFTPLTAFECLFQFIKERRRISNKGVTK